MTCDLGVLLGVAASGDKSALREFAAQAVDAMFAGQNVRVEHLAVWTRPVGWPLPAVKGVKGATSEYRPMAVLEYVQHCLKPQAPKPADDGSDLI